MRYVNHHPNDTTLVELDWSRWLGTAGIDVVTWTLPNTLTSVATAVSGNNASLHFSGGSLDDEYIIDCTVTSDDATPRKKTYSLFVRVLRTIL